MPHLIWECFMKLESFGMNNLMTGERSRKINGKRDTEKIGSIMS